MHRAVNFVVISSIMHGQVPRLPRTLAHALPLPSTLSLPPSVKTVAEDHLQQCSDEGQGEGDHPTAPSRGQMSMKVVVVRH